VGGDRCIFGQLDFGYETSSVDASTASFTNVVNQLSPRPGHKQIMALIDLIIVPLNVKIDVPAEEQIVNFVKLQCIHRNIPPENFFYDSGMRTALVSAFSRGWSPQTCPVDSGGSPTTRMVSDQIQMPCDKYYSKFITEMWFSVRWIIESGQFRGLKDGVMQEGCQREWTIVGANKTEVEPKAKMKEKTGKSPDLFDALAIGVEGARQRGFVISNAYKKQKESSETWHKKVQETAKKQWQEGLLNYSA